MRTIYHCVSRDDWQESGDPYRHASLDSEGFIHCTNADQVEAIANLFYADERDLLMIAIDADELGELVRDEVAPLPADLMGIIGLRAAFPHVYGPIPRSAILDVVALQRDETDQWQLDRD